MISIDLHTHSLLSPDGSISKRQYAKILENNILDIVAVTDHNTVDFAVTLHQEFGEKIIVGEEISTTSGDIIGLYLQATIPSGLSLENTVLEIKKQNGLVYVPHPFETVRSGISLSELEKISDHIDIIESCNGRAFFQNKGPEAYSWAHRNRIVHCASSDAHRHQALGKTYTQIDELPTKETLVELLKKSRRVNSRPSIGDIIAPKLNKFATLITR